MKNSARILVIGLIAVSVSSCSTQILTTTTTLPGVTTTSTIPVPSGTSLELLEQLGTVIEGLGQAIVDKDRATMNNTVAQTNAIWKVLEPQIRESGVDLVEDVSKIVNFVNVSVKRTRPADADKAVRYLALIMESAPTLLAE
jgi:hypothetical protein